MRDASCRALAESIPLLRARGAPVERLVEGLPLSLEDIQDPKRWLDWATFVEIIDRFQELCGGPEGYREFHIAMTHHPLTPGLRRVMRLAVSPQQAYRLLIHWLGPSLYPAHQTSLVPLPQGRLRIVLEIPPELPGSAAFMNGAHGSLIGLPRYLGLREARVEASIAPHRAEFMVQPPHSASLFTRLRRVWEVFRDSRSAIEELSEQQVELQKSFDALSESYSALQDREAQLETEIDDRKRAESALRDSEAQLRQAQKMEAIGRLAGGIAHDFNNLMTAVLGYTDVLETQVPPTTGASESLHEIRGAAERASKLTRQLLAFSRNQVLRPRVIDLNSIVSDLERMLRRVLGTDVELYSDLDPGLRAIQADPTQIEQVILNLALNARDAMPDGGRLTLATANVGSSGSADAQEWVRLSVRDTGAGMADDVRERIFDPFFTTKEVGRGTGLGLSTVYGIVKQTGGSIQVWSRPGEGSSFVIELPSVREVPETVERPTRPSKPVVGQETVLLVEDQATVRKLMNQMLSRAGYRVIPCKDGEEAIRASGCHPGPLDMVLSDVMLPALSGPEIVRRLREKRPGLRALLVSGYAEQAIAASDLNDPHTAFLGKPFAKDELLQSVRDVLDAE